MPVNPLLAARAATRVEAGRIIPSARFALDPGSLRGAMVNVKPKDRPQIAVSEVKGQKFVMAELKHPILTSIQLAAGPIATAEEMNGPILLASNAMVLPDKSDQKLRWVKTGFVVVATDEMITPPFVAQKVGTAQNGSDLWRADLTLPIRNVRFAATQSQIDQMSTRDPSLTFRDIPMTLREATLKLPYDTAEGPRVMELKGEVAPDQSSVSFSFTGDGISLAWRLLRETDSVRLELLSDYTGFEPVEAPQGVESVKPEPLGPIGARPELRPMFGHRIRAAEINARAADVPARARRLDHSAITDPRAIRLAALKDRKALVTGLRMQAIATAPAKTFAKQRMVASLVHTLDLRGPNMPALFVVEDATTGRQIPITHAPWAQTSGPIREIEEIDPASLGLGPILATRLRIYGSLVDIGLYYVVPSAYVLGREPETGRLQFYAEVISDPVNPENSAVRVSLGLVPEISPMEEVELRAALERHLDGMHLGAGATKLTIGYPTDLGNAPNLSWGDPLSQVAAPVIDGRAVLLSITTTTLGFAKAMFDTLATKGRVLTGQLTFSMPDGLTAQPSVLIGLTRTCGPTVRAVSAGGDLQLSELAGYMQTVLAVARCLGAGQVERIAMPAPIPLSPNAAVNARPAGLPDGDWASETRITIPDKVELDPQRINVDEMVTPVIISTALSRNADFAGRSLQTMLVEIKLPQQDVIGVSLTADPQDDFFDPQIVDFSVPLGRALASDGRVLDYRVTLRFDDGGSLQSAWQNHNFGANPDISIRRDLFA